ncbi:MAG TPA: ATP-binding cassette domain-containing protein [Acidimicrobiia bacterium]|nr:ATP-binding cassette domain-containing protein [Acidimicrobiia bacterium]
MHERPAIEVEDLVRRFGRFAAVDGMSFTVGTGELFGILGPNGAGKSTTISILCTLLRPTAGTARVAGYDVTTERDHVRSRIGVVFQEETLDEYLTAEENLRFHAVMYGVPAKAIRPRMMPLLAMAGLEERRKQDVRYFSSGMKRRLEIARGLLHTPEVLFLDEPTIGLDPHTRLHVWDYVAEVRARERTTMFLSTHSPGEAERCDRIAIMNEGRIVAIDTPDALKASVGADTVTLTTDDDARAAAQLEDRLHVDVARRHDRLAVAVPDGQVFVPKIFSALDIGVRSVDVRRPSLDDVFIKYTGHELLDADGDNPLQYTESSVMRALRSH